MATVPPEDGPGDADTLLGDHQGIKAPTTEVPGESATFAQRMANATEELRPVRNEPSGALEPPGLLIADQGDHDAPGRSPILSRKSQNRRHDHRHAAFHVDCATTPDVVIHQFTADGRVRPALA